MRPVTWREGGDLVTGEHSVVVSPVNCVGVAGKGLARTLATWFPQADAVYRRICRAGRLAPGRLLAVDTGDPERWRLWGSTGTGHESGPATGEPRGMWLVLLPTKRHWRSRSLPGDVRAGVAALARAGTVLEGRRPHDVGVPRLGCGLGGLDWREVAPWIRKAAEEAPDAVWTVYGSAPEDTATEGAQ